jgi:GT2 family glycosyltransferase
LKKVFSYVTTFNRLELLKKVIAGLENQTYDHQLTVINNSSEDDTVKWLESKGIPYITQPNVGSSGGQWRAVTEGLNEDCDYIWIMDDDVIPEPDCLKNLILESEKHGENSKDKTIVCPLRWGSDGKIFENEPLWLNITNPFKSIWGRIISEADTKADFVKAEGLTFEGPLISKKLAKEIGPPEFGFFIHADDTEYMLRASKAGATLGLATKARLDRMLPVPDINAEFTWKHYYIIRNIIALDVLHGTKAVRLLRPFFYLQSWLRRSNNSKDRKVTLKAFKDGYNYKKVIQEEAREKTGFK